MELGVAGVVHCQPGVIACVMLEVGGVGGGVVGERGKWERREKEKE